MFKLYQEHKNFGEYTAFNLALGKMELINKEEFDNFENEKLKFRNPILSPLHTQFPRRIYFQITRNCQLSCDYCYVKAGPKQPHLEKNIALNIADYLGKEGLMEVRLTGGEATVHPDFVEICERFFKNNVYISLGTNGLWNNSVKEFLAVQRYFCLAVTIDGSELTHKTYRQESHKFLLKNLSGLRKKNPYIRIRINMVVTKSNKYQYSDLVHFADDIAAESLTFLPLRPRLGNPELLKEVLSADEFRELRYNASRSYQPEKKYGQPTDSGIIRRDNEIFSTYRNRQVCAAGRERLNLSFDASKRKITTFACSFSPVMEETIDQRLRDVFIAGEFDYADIEKLKPIWQDDSRWDIFRDHRLKQPACSSCSSFGKSCGGTSFCHIQNHKYSQLNLEGDIKQQLRNQMLVLPVWCEHSKSAL